MAQFPKPFNPLEKFERHLDWILNTLTDMCDAPITVWIQKLWKPLGKLILSWYAVDLKNIFTAWLRPGLYSIEGRSNRHWGGGGRGKKRTGFKTPWRVIQTVVGWDPNEIIGKALAGHDELRVRALPPGSAFMWIFEGVIERLLFYWSVIDLGTEFVYEWMSSMEETKYCMASRDAVFLGRCGPYLLFPILGWDPVGTLAPEKMRNIDFFNGFGVMAFGNSGSAGVTARIEQLPGVISPLNVRIRIRCLQGPSVGAEEFADHTIMPGEQVDVGVGCSIASGDLVIAEILAESICQLVSAHVFYQQAFVSRP
jgi:hypothetical protein